MAKLEPVMEPLEVDADLLISEIQQRSAEEYARGSDAGESGAKTKEYLDETGLNSQAFSWGKSILKKLPKKDGQAKAMDVIRSLYAILPHLENHVIGQGTAEMQLEPDLPAPTADAVSPDSDPDFDEIEADADDFDAELQELAGADG